MYKSYQVYGKCRNCGTEVHITSIPEMYIGYSGLGRDEMLIALVNSGTITQVHDCGGGQVGIVEPTYFKEEE